jgi:hypothetical protein
MRYLGQIVEFMCLKVFAKFWTVLPPTETMVLGRNRPNVFLKPASVDIIEVINELLKGEDRVIIRISIHFHLLP